MTNFTGIYKDTGLCRIMYKGLDFVFFIDDLDRVLISSWGDEDDLFGEITMEFKNNKIIFLRKIPRYLYYDFILNWMDYRSKKRRKKWW